MKAIDRLLYRELSVKIALAAVWLLCLYTFLEFLELLHEIESDVGMQVIATLLVLSVPHQLYDLFPMILIVGTLLGLSTMARNSELLALQAGSVSQKRIARSILAFGCVLSAFIWAWGDFVVTTSEQLSSSIEREHISNDGRLDADAAVWLKEEGNFYQFGDFDSDGKIRGVKAYETENGNFLSAIYESDIAFLDEGAGVISLQNAVSRRFDDGLMDVRRGVELSIPTALTVSKLDTFGWEPAHLTTARLLALARFLKANGQDADYFFTTFWNRMVIPLSSIMMVLIITPFGFRSVGKKGAGYFTFFGVVVGLAYFAVQQSISYVVLLSGIAPLTGAVVTLGIFSVLAIVAYSRL